KNNLHSNPNGYHVRVWEANLGDNELGDCVTFSLFSPDGDQGYPGNLEVSVTYTLTEENALMIHYRAVGDQNTIVNLTNHSFFNLNGHESGSIINQDRKSTRLNSSHVSISYAVFCLKKKTK